MTLFLSLLIGGTVTGCLYALVATGLVVTYTSTGIFNFAHGAVAMASAFMFWQLENPWHVNLWLSAAITVFVIAPLAGVIVERVLMRPLDGAPVDVPIVVSLGLLLLLVGVAEIAWNPGTQRSLPQFFDGRGFRAADLLVSYEDVIAVAALILVMIGLRLMFTRARLGVALRAVVDNPRLLAIAGGEPERVKQFAWAISFSLAAVAGIILGATNDLNIFNLTLLVVDGYAAAIIGRLRSIPLTVAGALAIAIGENMMIGYLPNNNFLSEVTQSIPILVLFVVIIVLPQDRIRTASFNAPIAPRVAGLRSSLAAGLGVIIVAILLARILSSGNLRIGIEAFALALVLLSIVLLTGYGGMVSLCQMSFAGLGAVAMGHWGHGGSLLGVLAAVGLTMGVGALLALPALYLRGLYLALLTFAFATLMEQVLFGQILGSGGALAVARIKIPGFSTQSDGGFFVLSSVIFVACAVAVLMVRRGPFGRRIVAANDSPAACVTLGINVNVTKLVTFTVAAGIAGLAGAVYAGGPGQISTADFAALLSLVVLLLARVGGINTATGALLGAIVYSIYPILDTHFPKIGSAEYLLTGLAAISVGRDANGLGGRIAELGEAVRKRVQGAAPPDGIPVVPTVATGTAAAVFLTEEGDGLIGAGAGRW